MSPNPFHLFLCKNKALQERDNFCGRVKNRSSKRNSLIKIRCRLHVNQFKPSSAAVTNSPWLRGFRQTFHICRDSVSALLQGTLTPVVQASSHIRVGGPWRQPPLSSCSAAGLALSCAFRGRTLVHPPFSIPLYHRHLCMFALKLHIFLKSIFCG